MAATSLKLSDELKQRVANLVSGTDKSAHAFMVEAIELAVQPIRRKALRFSALPSLFSFRLRVRNLNKNRR